MSLSPSSSGDGHRHVSSVSMQLTKRHTNGVNKSESSDSSVIFVESKSVRQNDAMVNAAKAMNNLKVPFQWMTLKQVKALKNTEKSHLFVTDPFHGSVFNHLKSIGARIIGPLVILTVTDDEMSKLPDIPLSCPIYSQCMKKLIISVSGFETQRKEELRHKIEAMNGRFSPNLTNHVTHLVTDTIGSRKYYAISSVKRPVMTSRWIDGCFIKYQHQVLHANDEMIIKHFKLPIFQGLIVCVSQINPEERENIKKIIESNGGSYSAVLNTTVNCLLLPEFDPNDISDKMKFAIRNEIPSVYKNWVYKSRDYGYSLPFDDYRISVPKHIKPSKASLVMIEPQINDVKKKQNDGGGDTIHSNKRFDDEKSVPKVSDSTKSSVPLNEQIIERLKTLSADSGHDSFLEGCTIHVTGFDRPIIDFIKKIITNVGSLFMERFCRNVTHSIIGENCISKDLRSMHETISLTNANCSFVTIEWLYECFRQKEAIECTNYCVANNNGDDTKVRIAYDLSPKKMKYDIKSPPIRKYATLIKKDNSDNRRVHKNRNSNAIVNDESSDEYWPITWTDLNTEAGQSSLTKTDVRIHTQNISSDDD